MAIWQQYSHLFINSANFGYSFYFTNSSHLCDIFFTGSMAVFTHEYQIAQKPLTCSAGRKYGNRAFQAIREPVLRGLSWVPGIKEECRETIAFSYFDGLPVSPLAWGNRIFVE
jgi:hypothetical protein